MAAPTFVQAATGATDAGGTWSYGASANSTAVGNLFVAQILQDGTTNGAITGVVGITIEDLTGTDDLWTQVIGGNADGSFPVGSAAAGRQFLWLGRSINLGTPIILGENSTSEDLYMRMYEFTNVSTGTTIATVLENGTAGATPNGAATSATVADTGVTTLGVDRLAVNFGAITDDASGIALFAGATGGTWAHFQSYESASGTDGTVFFEDAAMASAGTINGGTDTIVSLPWGVVGFALCLPLRLQPFLLTAIVCISCKPSTAVTCTSRVHPDYDAYAGRRGRHLCDRRPALLSRCCPASGLDNQPGLYRSQPCCRCACCDPQDGDAA